MKRFLYVFLAAAVSGVGPAPVTEADLGLEEAEESSCVEQSSVRDRSYGGTAANGTIVVRPMSPDESLDPAIFGASLIVDQNVSYVAAVRDSGPVAASEHAAQLRLLDAALHDAAHRGDLKTEIDSRLALPSIVALCSKHRFLYWRTVQRGERPVHVFLADLYSAPRGQSLPAPHGDASVARLPA